MQTINILFGLLLLIILGFILYIIFGKIHVSCTYSEKYIKDDPGSSTVISGTCNLPNDTSFIDSDGNPLVINGINSTITNFKLSCAQCTVPSSSSDINSGLGIILSPDKTGGEGLLGEITFHTDSIGGMKPDGCYEQKVSQCYNNITIPMLNKNYDSGKLDIWIPSTFRNCKTCPDVNTDTKYFVKWGMGTLFSNKTQGDFKGPLKVEITYNQKK